MVDIAKIPLLVAKEAIAFFRRKGFQIGFDWRDVWQEEHTRAFTVAKAMSRSLLEEIRGALDEALTEGQSLDEFRKGLKPKLIKRGWWGKRPMVDPQTGEQKAVQLGSDQRLKIIYRTNMRTAYQAGRWERIQKTKAAFPYIRYASVLDGREREEHGEAGWHGTILPVDHPWWDTHYPPCDWECRCTATAINQRMMDRRGWKLTEKPKRFPDRNFTNKRTGEVMRLERGVGAGWSYNVGKAYLDGLTPDPLPESFGEGDATAAAADIETAIGGFLAAFDLDQGEHRIFIDRDGWPLAISAGWFRTAEGEMIIPAGMHGRISPALVGRAIAAPDKIRWVWVRDRDGRACLMRRYRRQESFGLVEVDVGGVGWRFRLVGEARAIAAYNPNQEREKKGTRKGGRWTESAAAAHVRRALADGAEHSVTDFGPVTQSNIDLARRKAGFDLTGYSRIMQSSEIRHVDNNHGDPVRERNRKPHAQVMVTPADFPLIPSIVANATSVELVGEPKSRKLQRLNYTSTVLGRTYIYTEEIRPGAKLVQLKSMRKLRKKR